MSHQSGSVAADGSYDHRRAAQDQAGQRQSSARACAHLRRARMIERNVAIVADGSAGIGAETSRAHRRWNAWPLASLHVWWGARPDRWYADASCCDSEGQLTPGGLSRTPFL